MDWKLFGATFAAVFLAELGDKTQLATVGLAAEGHAPWTVFAGSAAALCTSSLLAVLAGGLIGRYLAPTTLRRAAGVLFLALGALMLVRPA